VKLRSAGDLFRAQYGRLPDVVASAPGRVNIIGEHLDYNGGEVLPIAIGMRLQVAIGRTARGVSRFVSADEADRGELSVAAPERRGKWYDYATGSLRMLSEGGVDVPEMDIAVGGNLPIGSGLSSSAALCVATLTAVDALLGYGQSKEEIARLAHRAETKFVGVPVGIMDQFACTLAMEDHALHILCETEEWKLVPFSQPVLVFDTGVRRGLRDSAFDERRRECARTLELIRQTAPELSSLAHATPRQIESAGLPEPLMGRARHVVSEAERVRTVVQQLRERGSIDGELLTESHASLRRDYACSTPELDWFVEFALRAPGIDGARLTGAGWGGCAIAVGSDTALAELSRASVPSYEEQFQRSARAWLVRASNGARLE
jgi:galactokinase